MSDRTTAKDTQDAETTAYAARATTGAELLRRYDRLDWIQERSQIPEQIISTSTLAHWFEAALDRIPDPEFPGPGAALNRLALGASIEAHVVTDRPYRVHTAMRAGATWREVAAALHITAKEARQILREHTAKWKGINSHQEERGKHPAGYSKQQEEAMLALLKLRDTERSPLAAQDH